MGFGVIFETVCGMDDPHGCGKCRNMYGTTPAAASEPPGMGLRRVEKGHTETHAGGNFKLKINQQYQSTQHQKSALSKA